MSKRQQEKARRRKLLRKTGPVRAELKFLRTGPRKVRLLLDLIRGESVEEAITILKFSQKRAASPLLKLLYSAVANADGRDGFDVDNLIISHATANEGPILRRWLPRAMGRATRIRKRTSHVRLELKSGSKNTSHRIPIRNRKNMVVKVVCRENVCPLGA